MRSLFAGMFILVLLFGTVGTVNNATAQEATPEAAPVSVTNPTFFVDEEEAAYCTKCIEAEVIQHDEERVGYFEYSLNPENVLGKYNVWFFKPGTSLCTDAGGSLMMQIIGGDPIGIPLDEGMICIQIPEGAPLMWLAYQNHLYFSRVTPEELAAAINHPEAAIWRIGFLPVPDK
jgi:hypothetical protein